MCKHQEFLRAGNVTAALECEVQLENHLRKDRSTSCFVAVNLLRLRILRMLRVGGNLSKVSDMVEKMKKLSTAQGFTDFIAEA